MKRTARQAVEAAKRAYSQLGNCGDVITSAIGAYDVIVMPTGPAYYDNTGWHPVPVAYFTREWHYIEIEGLVKL